MQTKPNPTNTPARAIDGPALATVALWRESRTWSSATATVLRINIAATSHLGASVCPATHSGTAISKTMKCIAKIATRAVDST